MAASYLETQRIENARKAIDRLKMLFPADGLVFYLEGLLHGRRGESAQEIKAYRRALESTTSVASIHYNLAIALEEAKEPVEAAKAYGAALDLDPTSLDVRLNLGALLCGLGRYDEAARILVKGTKSHPKCTDLWFNLGCALAAAKQGGRAIGAFKKALAIDRHFADAHFEMAKLQFNRGDYDKAIAGCKKVIEIEPDRHKAYYNLAFAYDKTKRYERALEVYRKVLSFRPDDHKTYAKIGLVYSHMGQLVKARTACERSLELEGEDNLEAQYQLSRILEATGDLEGAIRELKEVVRAKKGYRSAQRRLGSLLRKSGDLDAAAEEARKAAKEERSADAYYELGRVYGAQGQDGLAETSFQKAVKLDPRHTKSVAALAGSLLKRGRAEKALRTCTHAVEAGAKSAGVFQVLGQAQEACAQYREAIRSAKRALKLNKKLPPPYLLIARCYGELDDQAKKEQYEKRYRDARRKDT